MYLTSLFIQPVSGIEKWAKPLTMAMEKCSFSGNSAVSTYGDSDGGALYFKDVKASTLTLTSCSFSDNTAVCLYLLLLCACHASAQRRVMYAAQWRRLLLFSSDCTDAEQLHVFKKHGNGMQLLFFASCVLEPSI